ncbi:LOW QUALITY PROTEIN: uncharacterized protein PS065_003319 [Dugong dugon]
MGSLNSSTANDAGRPDPLQPLLPSSPPPPPTRSICSSKLSYGSRICLPGSCDSYTGSSWELDDCPESCCGPLCFAPTCCVPTCCVPTFCALAPCLTLVCTPVSCVSSPCCQEACGSSPCQSACTSSCEPSCCQQSSCQPACCTPSPRQACCVPVCCEPVCCEPVCCKPICCETSPCPAPACCLPSACSPSCCRTSSSVSLLWCPMCKPPPCSHLLLCVPALPPHVPPPGLFWPLIQPGVLLLTFQISCRSFPHGDVSAASARPIPSGFDNQHGRQQSHTSAPYSGTLTRAAPGPSISSRAGWEATNPPGVASETLQPGALWPSTPQFQHAVPGKVLVEACRAAHRPQDHFRKATPGTKEGMQPSRDPTPPAMAPSSLGDAHCLMPPAPIWGMSMCSPSVLAAQRPPENLPWNVSSAPVTLLPLCPGDDLVQDATSDTSPPPTPTMADTRCSRTCVPAASTMSICSSDRSYGSRVCLPSVYTSSSWEVDDCPESCCEPTCCSPTCCAPDCCTPAPCLTLSCTPLSPGCQAACESSPCQSACTSSCKPSCCQQSSCQPACCTPSPCQQVCCMPICCKSDCRKPVCCVPVCCKSVCCKPVCCKSVCCKPVCCKPVCCKSVCCKPVCCKSVCCKSVCCKPVCCKPVCCKSVCCKPVYSKSLCCVPVCCGAAPCPSPTCCQPPACAPSCCRPSSSVSLLCRPVSPCPACCVPLSGQKSCC